MRQGSWSPTRIALGLIVSISVGAGCAEPVDGPRDRIGALPFPGPFTLFRAADPEDLGEHRYERSPRVFHPDEVGHGIIYTTRAGFIDIAHVRITIDTVRFCATRVRIAIAEHRELVTLPTIEGSVFYVSLTYPRSWPASPMTAADERVADELALRAGQRLANLMMNWHEVITWFGYRTLPFVDEQPSAFLYDDTMSHVVGLRVAGRVLRVKSASSFDEAVTIALHDELKQLGAVSPAETEQAARAVEGVWWSRGKPLKRQLDIGLLDGAVRPWLVPGFPFDGGKGAFAAPESFLLPTLKNIGGRDFSGFCSVSIDPEISEGDRMRESLPSWTRLFDADRDFPLLVEATRRQMQARLGADVDQPWPTPAIAARPTTLPAIAPQPLTLAPTPPHPSP